MIATHNSRPKNAVPLILRGMFGGLLGGFAWAIGMFLFSGYLNFGRLGPLFFYLRSLPFVIVYFSFIGIALGASIGTVIWLVVLVSKKTIGGFGRAVIGIFCSIALVAVASYIKDSTGDNPTLWAYIGYLIAFGVVVGVVPGMMARPKTS